jgi:ribosomal protein S18 acetylase RimI-like enzyme
MTAQQPYQFELRPARAEDIPVLLELIHGLAEFERLTHLFANTHERLHQALFGEHPAAEALLAWGSRNEQRLAVGFALYFHNYSTFLGSKGLYLEDLFVRPEFRGRGCGKALLVELARIAVQRGCGRFEWAVLDWNMPAQKFYQALGASVLPDWRIVRTTGDALTKLASLQVRLR